VRRRRRMPWTGGGARKTMGKGGRMDKRRGEKNKRERKRNGEEKKRKKEKMRKKKKKEKEKCREGQIRHFTIPLQQVKLFCQIFCKMAPAPPEKPLH
jgi:hypothetical protein